MLPWRKTSIFSESIGKLDVCNMMCKGSLTGCNYVYFYFKSHGGTGRFAEGTGDRSVAAGVGGGVLANTAN